MKKIGRSKCKLIFEKWKGIPWYKVPHPLLEQAHIKSLSVAALIATERENNKQGNKKWLANLVPCKKEGSQSQVKIFSGLRNPESQVINQHAIWKSVPRLNKVEIVRLP